jgi:glutaredoxin 2
MNVLNITGQYNDYFIPKSASGEAPIDFEVLQGQQFDPKMEFLQQFEDYAIGCTGVPIELISSRQSVDYALQLTMTNSKHIRIVYKDQANVQRIAGKIVTRIYNAEYDENVSLTVKLPPPLYIAMSNTSQLLTNTTDYMEKILVPDMQAKGASENAINAAKMVYMRKTLGTYMNFDDIEEAERQGMQQTASVSPDEGE